MRRLRSALLGAVLVAGACDGDRVTLDAPADPILLTYGTPTEQRARAVDPEIASFQSLSLETLTSGRFGRLFSYSVDGYVYAKPLFVPEVPFAGGARDALFVATEHDSVYAFDANGLTLDPLWSVSLLKDGETTVPAADTLTTDIVPEIGITGTPVIDRGSGLLYCVSKAKRADGRYIQRLHALRLVDGQEANGAPIDIIASVPGTATDAVDGQIAFEPLRHNQRAALALYDGHVWIAWASHGDALPYHGWVMVYDTANLTKPPAALVTTPDGMQGGIWMGAAGPTVDANGNVYLASGNGTFDDDAADDAHTNFGLSELKLHLDGDTLRIVDWFSPNGTIMLNNGDLDFGTIGTILMPDLPGVPSRVMTAAKTGMIYILNRDALGHYDEAGDRVFQSFWIGSDFLISNPVLYGDTLYVCPHHGALKAFKMDGAGHFPATPTAQAPTCITCFSRGSTPIVYADGDHDPILWILDNSGYAKSDAAVLRAYLASDITQALYDSDASSRPNKRDFAAPAVKFTQPVIANHTVFVGGQLAVTAYGALAR